MSSLGIVSFYSAYASQSNSVYSSTPVRDKQEFSNAENETTSAFSDEINDEAIISDEAKALFETDKSNDAENKSTDKSNTKQHDTEKSLNNREKLTPEQQQEVVKLKARDTEVKTHEQAHIAAAGGLRTSAPNYEYQTGPDGQEYAIGGEVNISFVQGRDPEENIANAETLKAAALAPAQPSGQDLAVARNADKLIAEAKQQMAEQEAEKPEPTDKFNKTEKTDETKKAANYTSSDTKIETSATPANQLSSAII